MEQEENSKEEWSEVDTKTSEEEKNKVEYEVEGGEEKEEKAIPLVETKKEEEVEEEIPKELEGVETKGAQKRIRQLVKQRKERDDQLAQLIQQNEQLNSRLQTTEHQFNTVNQLSLNASEKQITDKLELARNAYKSAHEEGDSTKILQAQEFLNEAQNDLNIIRERANLLPFEAQSETMLLDELFIQRQKELFTEWGHRWLDLKRSKRAQSVFGADPLWDSGDLLYPIPTQELIKNPNLTQNDGY